MNGKENNTPDYFFEADRQIGAAETALVRASVALCAAGHLDIAEEIRAISFTLQAVQIPGQG